MGSFLDALGIGAAHENGGVITAEQVDARRRPIRIKKAVETIRAVSHSHGCG